jgi:hypothetical protein
VIWFVSGLIIALDIVANLWLQFQPRHQENALTRKSIASQRLLPVNRQKPQERQKIGTIARSGANHCNYSSVFVD